MSPKGRINRREFVKGVGGAAVAAIGLPYVISSKVLANPPSGRITLGFIGMGKQGGGLLWSFLQEPGCRVLAVCDVDEQKLGRARAMVDDCYAMSGECAGYRDFREVLARRDIDGVVIATPDHWHSIISVEACRAGKDVYCEKPLAITVVEARKIVTAVGLKVSTGLRDSPQRLHRPGKDGQVISRDDSGVVGVSDISRRL